MKAIKTILAIIVTASFVSNVSATGMNGMTKQDKATATGVSVSALNTASRAAVAQNFGTGGALAASQARTAAITADHNAKIGAQLTKANQTRTQQQIDANKAARSASPAAATRPAPVAATAQPKPYGYQNPHEVNPLAVPQYNPPVGTSLKNITLAKTAVAANKPANSKINVDASTLGNAPVNVNGKTVPASSLPAGTQVSVPMVSAFSPATHKGGHDRGTHSLGEHGTGNGPNNAQNSRSAGGLADSHVGGGRSGGGFHY